MTFKNYLHDIKEDKDTSRKIWSWIKNWRLPITPKFFEETFANKEQFCFMSIKPQRLNSLYNRQLGKNQMSTFTEYSSPDIFWGAGDLSWKNINHNDATAVAVLKGKVTIKGTSDLWTFYELNGRRWIDVKSVSKINSDVSKVLNKIQDNIKHNFPRELKSLNLEVLTWNETKLGNITWKNDNIRTPQRDKELNKVIKLYFDVSYASIRKYQKELIHSYQIGIAKGVGYNEHLCYSYVVQDVFVLSTDSVSTKEYYKNELSIIKNPKYIETVKELQKELKTYENKGK